MIVEERYREYEECSKCGNGTFVVFRDTRNSIGTFEECSECGER